MNGFAAKYNRKIEVLVKDSTLLDIKQVAERLHVSVRQVYKLMSEGCFLVVKVGGATRFISADIDNYIVKNTY